jgi:hypothetical protein
MPSSATWDYCFAAGNPATFTPDNGISTGTIIYAGPLASVPSLMSFRVVGFAI